MFRVDPTTFHCCACGASTAVRNAAEQNQSLWVSLLVDLVALLPILLALVKHYVNPCSRGFTMSSRDRGKSHHSSKAKCHVIGGGMSYISG